MFSPVITNVTYINNTAQYGPNIASYPIKVKVYNAASDDIIFNNFGSGIRITEPISLALVDHFDNIMVLDNASQISIISSASHLITGTNVRRVTSGVATFDDLVFISSPGASGVEFPISSKSIDSEVVQADMTHS